MNEKEQLVMEQEIEKGHIVKAVLVFLESFLQEQRAKTLTMIEDKQSSRYACLLRQNGRKSGKGG